MSDILFGKIEERAKALGFVRIGVTSVEPFERGNQALRKWLKKGYQGEMQYMENHEHLRQDPKLLFEEAKSILTLALPYTKPAQETHNQVNSNLEGCIASYAQRADYHHVIKQKLSELENFIQTLTPDKVQTRSCVDSAPLFEHEASERSGIGFTGKNTLTILPGTGSFVSLGVMLLNLELPQTKPAKNKCGDCTLCLSACPTNAFVGPYLLDARRCISYLTIELKSIIPEELRSLIGDKIFGCDICQSVCPFNASKKEQRIPSYFDSIPRFNKPSLIDILNFTSSQHKKFVADSPLKRVSRIQLARNAAVALGNSKNSSALPHLKKRLEEEKSELVRIHIQWAIEQLQPA